MNSSTDRKTAYSRISESDFRKKIAASKEILKSCTLCGNLCRVDRAAGELGKCEIDSSLYVSSCNIHTGEEPPISGHSGSGTVFLTGCCLECNFCQNFPISQLNNGKKMTPKMLASKMCRLQKAGAHNINFVSPTHQVPQIIESVYEARKIGLSIPIVYNTGGYDTLDALELLDGLVDIYLPDFKYADDRMAMKYSKAPDYVRTARKAFLEIYRQVGELAVDRTGIAERGTIIRHLVLPDGEAGTKEVFDWIGRNLSKRVHLSIMGQYFPAYKAFELGPKRRITIEEYEEAIAAVVSLGFENIFRQEIVWDAEEVESHAEEE